MLHADKQALENNLKVRLIYIREKELNFYTQNCRAVGTQAALMAGFAYSAIIYTKMDYFQQAHWIVKTFYCTMLTMTMCSAILVLTITTLLAMCGPGLALRGPEGSIHKAVDEMRVEYRMAFYLLIGTIVLFHVCVLVYSFGGFESIFTSIIIDTVVFCSLFTMQLLVRRIHFDFMLPTSLLVSGQFFDKAGYMDEKPQGLPGSQNPKQQQAQTSTSRSVEGWKQNTKFENASSTKILERNQKLRFESNQRCFHCINKSPATVKCLQCGEVFCYVCVVQLHNVDHMLNHSLVKLDTGEPFSIFRCQGCKQRQVAVICTACRHAFCEECSEHIHSKPKYQNHLVEEVDMQGATELLVQQQEASRSATIGKIYQVVNSWVN